MTDYDTHIPRPDPVVQALVAGFVDAIQRDRALRDQVRAALLATEADAWVSQSESQLGRRRHIAHVRAAVAAGDDRVRIIGRRHLARRDVYDGWLLAHGRMQVARADARDTAADDLAAELGLEVVR